MPEETKENGKSVIDELTADAARHLEDCDRELQLLRTCSHNNWRFTFNTINNAIKELKQLKKVAKQIVKEENKNGVV